MTKRKIDSTDILNEPHNTQNGLPKVTSGLTFGNKKRRRVDQFAFRQKLLKKYETCVITGHSFHRSDACHIKPFSICSEEEKYDISNGIILDSGIHKLFDKYMLTINPSNSQIEIKKHVSNIDKSLEKYDGKKIDVLDSLTLKYLEHHYRIYSK